MRKTTAIEGEATVEIEATNGHGADGVVLKDSSALADWEMADLEEAEPEPEEKRGTDLETQIEAMTPEEAETVLRDLTEYEGRLPLKVKDRVGEEKTYYVRMPKDFEVRVAERGYNIELHQSRRDGIPMMSELMQELVDKLTPDQNEKYLEIERNDKLSNIERTQALIGFFFSETPYLTDLVRRTADVSAQRVYNSMLASSCVEMFVEKDEKRKWSTVWATSVEFEKEDSDIVMDVILGMNEVHQKLQNHRFFRSSSDGAEPGTPKS